MHGQENLRNIVKSYDDLFSVKLGLLKDVQVSLEMTEDAKPIFIKLRKVPYDLIESVEKEIMKLE